MAYSGRFALRLRPSIVVLFLLLSLPLFIATVWINYATNDSIARDTAHQLIEKARFETITSSTELVDPIKSLVKVAASLGEAEPEFFRQERAAAYMTEMLAHSSNISSVYAAFDDGSFRMSLVLPPGGRIQDKAVPAGARLATRWLDRKAGGTAQDRYVFFDAQGQPVGRSEAAAVYDPRVRPWFKDSVAAGRRLSVSEPYIFATTGLPGITIAMPFFAGGKVAGVVAADITLDSLSKFLASRPVSPNSLSLIVDDDDRIIAHPDASQAIRREDGKLLQNSLSRLSSKLPALAMASRPDKDSERFTFVDAHSGREYVAMFAKFPPTVGKAWRVMIIAPLADFSRKWTENNRKVLIFGAIAVALQVLLIYFLSMLIARPIEQLEKKVIDVQNFVSSPSRQIHSRIPEISSLIHAVNTLDSTIHAFSAFVPKGLVQQLLRSNQRLELGGSSRFLTIFFSDIESFSTLAETSPAQELLLRVSAYLEAVTHAVNHEQGTIDKFIGDGVMAFWGAPAILRNHAFHACVAALRVQASMRKLNQQWILEGLRPLNVRIGIHSDSVLVGNIGSAERMSYTVMGDGVNLASRLEGANKEFGTQVCISQTVFKEAGEQLWLRPINVVTVKGRRSDMEIYELVGIRGGDPELEATPEQIRLCVLTQHAYQAFSQGDVATALHRYTEIQREYPADPLSRAMVALCRQPQDASRSPGLQDPAVDQPGI
jgi:adenylate cyclase